MFLVESLNAVQRITHSSVEPGRGANEVNYFNRRVFRYRWHELYSFFFMSLTITCIDVVM